MTYDVLIVGAGAAGLAALESIQNAGLSAALIEARDRIGGRILTVHDPLASLPIELGAEFIHGRPPEIFDIVNQQGLEIYQSLDTTNESRNWISVDSLLSDMHQAAQKQDQSFEEFLSSTTNYDQQIKAAARGFIEGFNACEGSKISIQALTEDDIAADKIDGGHSFHLVRGYDAVPRHLSAGQAVLNTIVEQIRWTRGNVSLQTNRGEWAAKRAIVTLPLGVLKSRRVHFLPEPTRFFEDLEFLEFGQVYRIVFRFRTPFWQRRGDLADTRFILSREKFFPTWWTTLPKRTSLLTSWSAGAHAVGLENLTPRQLADLALESLSRTTNISLTEVQDELETFYFHNWSADPFSLGAYSYVKVGGVEARKRLSEPIDDTLFFAGEATDNAGHSATVHGAIASGRRAARQVVASHR